ncbi:MAG TPA: hypothetical protein VHD56_08595 [Tepidisphaeraceae bacterium]|nr:hypothetical protein [Tepidisphaeraceae bacterium]
MSISAEITRKANHHRQVSDPLQNLDPAGMEAYAVGQKRYYPFPSSVDETATPTTEGDFSQFTELSLQPPANSTSTGVWDNSFNIGPDPKEMSQWYAEKIDGVLGQIGQSQHDIDYLTNRLQGSAFRNTRETMPKWTADIQNRLNYSQSQLQAAQQQVTPLVQGFSDWGGDSFQYTKSYRYGEEIHVMSGQGLTGALNAIHTRDYGPTTSSTGDDVMLTSIMLTGPARTLGGELNLGNAAQSVGRFFYDPRDFRLISKEYWAARGGAEGSSLHHWLFPQRATWIPKGIRNAGFNLVELAPMRGFFHPTLSLNTWMGFATRWGPAEAREAAKVELGMRAAIPAAGTAAAVIGYKTGKELYKLTLDPNER